MPTFVLEIKKLWKRKSTWLAVGVTIAAICALFFFQQETIEQMEATNEQVFEDHLFFYNQVVDEAEEGLETFRTQGDAEAEEEQRLLVERYQASLHRFETRRDAYYEGDWQTFYQDDIEGLEFLLEPSNHASYSIEDQDVSNFAIRASLEEKRALIEAEADPLLQRPMNRSMMPTLYDAFTGVSLTSWTMGTTRVGTDGLTILLDFVKVHFIPIVLLVTIFLFGNTASSELRRKRRGMHFFHVQPVGKTRVFWSKYMVGLLHVVLFSAALLSVPLLLSLLTRGLGSLAFPVLVYDGPDLSSFNGRTPVASADYDTFTFIPLSEYFFQSGMVAAGLAIAGYSLYFLLSFWLRHPGVTLLTTIVVSLGIGYVWQSPYNPFQYLSIDRIVTQQNRVLLLNFDYTWQLGAGLLLGFGILCTLVALGVFRKVAVK